MSRTWLFTSSAILIILVLSSGCTFTAPASPTVAPVTKASTPEIPAATLTASRAPAQATPSLTPSPDKETAVLEQTAQSLCTGPYPPPEITAGEATYQLACIWSAGHSTTVIIRRLTSLAEAQAAFRAAAQGRSIRDWHGYPVAEWEEPYPGLPEARYRIWVWQADRWLIRITSFDDTHFRSALEPSKVAETVYQFAIQQGLLSP